LLQALNRYEFDESHGQASANMAVWLPTVHPSFTAP
jgi:hypothetical protein